MPGTGQSDINYHPRTSKHLRYVASDSQYGISCMCCTADYRCTVENATAVVFLLANRVGICFATTRSPFRAKTLK